MVPGDAAPRPPPVWGGWVESTPERGETGAAEGRGYIARRTRSPQETTIATTRALRATPLQKWLRGERRLCMGFSPLPRGEPAELLAGVECFRLVPREPRTAELRRAFPHGVSLETDLAREVAGA